MLEDEGRRNRHTKQHESICPACDAVIRVRKPPRKGQLITCKDCDSLLVVKRAAPLSLEWAFEEPTTGEDGPGYYYIEGSSP